MTSSTFALVLIVIFLVFLLWKLYEEIRDWRLFKHHSENEFVMNLSTVQAMGIFKHTPRITAIDVRPPVQFKSRHLPNALNASFQSGELDLSMIEHLDRSTPLLVYCEGGHRSRKALKPIEAMGFHSIYHLNRGFMMWRLFSGPFETAEVENS